MNNLACVVDEIVKDCLNGVEEGAVIVEGLVRSFGFNPERIKAHREEIRAALNEMKPEFHIKTGGGYSFLALPFTKDDEQWGEQVSAEALLCLGIAAGMVKILLPRALWSALPGGVPYLSIDTVVDPPA